MAKIDPRIQFEDPAYWERRRSASLKRIEGFQKPWNRTAKAVLKDHKQELAGKEQGLLAGRKQQPSDRDLQRLKTIATRVGVVNLEQGENPPTDTMGSG